MQASESVAKISRPRLSGAYPRVRLFNAFDENHENPIVWITSPPGAGKTTLISTYLESRNYKTLWYQVDESDADLPTFFYYLGLAARKAKPRKRKALPLLTPEYKFGIPVFSRNFFRELFARLDGEFVLVFDNFQEAGDDSELHAAIVMGMEELPERGRVFIISRTEPPPKFARLRANNMINHVQWDDMKLTENELENILILKGRAGLPVEKLYARTRGWLAGLTLLLEQSDIAEFFLDDEDQFNPKILFDYFAGEVLEHTDMLTRKFLLKTALMPKFSSGMASQLTGINDTSNILNNLLVKNYFTYKHEGSTATFEYHPLFRDFLNTQAQELLSEVELTVAKWNAAEILHADNQIEAAVQLLLEVGDWEKLTNLIVETASSLIRQGRHKTLTDWINKIPDTYLKSTPWLLYWSGSAIYPFNPDVSLSHLQKAFDLFRKQDDPRGIYLTWAAAVEASRTGSQADVKALDFWINILDDLLLQYPDFPDADIEARVAFVMHTAIVWRMPHHPKREEWRERLMSIWMNVTDTALFSEIGAYTAAHDMIVGNYADALQVFETLKQSMPEESMSPVARIVLCLSDSFISWRTGNSSRSVEAANKGIEMILSTGIHMWEEVIISQGMSGALISGDLNTANDFHNKLQGRPQGYRSAHYHYVESWYHVVNRDYVAAKQSAELALKSATESGTIFFEAMAHMALATVSIRRGQNEEAKAELEIALKISRKGRLYSLIFRCLLEQAWLTYREGDRQTAINRLRECFVLGYEKGYTGFATWLPEVISEMSVLALESGIETEYVRYLINKINITPVEPPYHLNNWPWHVRIKCLGHFELFKIDKPVEFSRKTQKKPVNLIKALIAFGAQDVPDEKLIEAIWPDAEGDAGHKSLTITLHRVRKLLGEDIVITKEGRLTLDSKRIWTDVRAFEYTLDKFEQALIDNLINEHTHFVEQALSLYQGHFLADDLDCHWAIPMREKLRNKFIRCVEKYGTKLELAGKYDKAVYWYQKGLEIDMFAEQFYQRLMYCYEKLGRVSDAIEIYRQCFRILTTNLKVEPSKKTKEIYTGLAG